VANSHMREPRRVRDVERRMRRACRRLPLMAVVGGVGVDDDDERGLSGSRFVPSSAASRLVLLSNDIVVDSSAALPSPVTVR